jgi:hypothetical protein|tara:strand:- start:440 stop:640 length:201 start_codon:yes stop_codon:yes gene_type:complete
MYRRIGIDRASKITLFPCSFPVFQGSQERNSLLTPSTAKSTQQYFQRIRDAVKLHCEGGGAEPVIA